MKHDKQKSTAYISLMVTSIFYARRSGSFKCPIKLFTRLRIAVLPHKPVFLNV